MKDLPEGKSFFFHLTPACAEAPAGKPCPSKGKGRVEIKKQLKQS